MFIETHFIQNFAPSNLNRDDTNNPKDCDFGGTRRARISSQCLKRAIRSQKVFVETTSIDLAVRTRWLNDLLFKALTGAGKNEEQARKVANASAEKYCKLDKDHTSVLLFLSQSEINSLAGQLIEKWDSILQDEKMSTIDTIAKELFRSLKNRTGAPDIALFGRMLAEKPELNIDAACQVAHAFSTHTVNMDMDFFTAVEELQKEDNAGAGMMGMSGFNSSCFYRYACIDFGQLVKNLDGDVSLAKKTVEAYLRASVNAIPTGKQNSHAAQNLPSFYMSVVRNDSPACSLANAFEKPVYARQQGYVSPSITALDQYWQKLSKFFAFQGKPVVTTLNEEEALDSLKPYYVETLESWINDTLAQLPKE